MPRKLLSVNEKLQVIEMSYATNKDIKAIMLRFGISQTQTYAILQQEAEIRMKAERNLGNKKKVHRKFLKDMPLPSKSASTAASKSKKQPNGQTSATTTTTTTTATTSGHAQTTAGTSTETEELNIIYKNDFVEATPEDYEEFQRCVDMQLLQMAHEIINKIPMRDINDKLPENLCIA